MPASRRSHRAAAAAAPYTRPTDARHRHTASASVAGGANGKGPLKLTVKAAPSKLRQITSSSAGRAPYVADTPSESDATPAPVARGARSTRNPRTVVEPDSDEDLEEEEDEEEEEEEEEEEAEDDDDEIEVSHVTGMADSSAIDQELLANEDSEGDEEDEEDEEGDEEDEEDEDEDADGEDEEMEDHPPPPIIKQERAPGKSKPRVTVRPPPEGTLKSVEDKEMEDDDDDELSELESAEGEMDVDDSDADEDDENSRSATPDLSKLTKRQRGQFEEMDDGSLMALSNEAQKKKHLTAEEHAMRRAEMARRRKNLSEKRNEEEKQDTINKLLKKPAPKRRSRAEMAAAALADGTPGEEDGDEERPDSLYVRWVSSRDGTRAGVPVEWLDTPAGAVFRPTAGAGKMVEEVA